MMRNFCIMITQDNKNISRILENGHSMIAIGTSRKLSSSVCKFYEEWGRRKRHEADRWMTFH